MQTAPPCTSRVEPPVHNGELHGGPPCRQGAEATRAHAPGAPPHPDRLHHAKRRDPCRSRSPVSHYLLRRHGWSHQGPARRAIERDEAAITERIEET
nr:winged helix-turn-helix domain-containing protein [Streptacidiphilus albus]